MRGIFSAAPGQTAIRLLVGTHLLLLVQAYLVLNAAGHLDGVLRVLVAGIALIGASAFVAAVHGGPDREAQPWHARQARRRRRYQGGHAGSALADDAAAQSSRVAGGRR